VDVDRVRKGKKSGDRDGKQEGDGFHWSVCAYGQIGVSHLSSAYVRTTEKTSEVDNDPFSAKRGFLGNGDLKHAWEGPTLGVLNEFSKIPLNPECRGLYTAQIETAAGHESLSGFTAMFNGRLKKTLLHKTTDSTRS
jgi:hypothetical protein